MTRASNWTDSRELLSFYENHRNRPEDLYPSELHFLPWLAERVDSVLDVGCAAGGFRTIWQSFAPGIRYEGVDLSPSLVEAARRPHPDTTFHVGDAVDGIDLPDRDADVVQALGWLHWVPEWERALTELWRLTDRFLFFDARAFSGAGARVGRQRLELGGSWDGETATPYLVVPWEDLARKVAAFRPRAVRARGYWGAPAASAEDVPESVCFVVFVVERGSGRDAPLLELDLPFDWPETEKERS